MNYDEYTDDKFHKDFQRAADILIRTNCLRQTQILRKTGYMSALEQLKKFRAVTVGCGRASGKTHYMVDRVSTLANPDDDGRLCYYSCKALPVGKAVIVAKRNNINELEQQWVDITGSCVSDSVEIIRADDTRKLSSLSGPIASVWIDNYSMLEDRVVNEIEGSVAPRLNPDKPSVMVRLV